MTVKAALKDGGEDHRAGAFLSSVTYFPLLSLRLPLSLIPTTPIKFPACLFLSEWCGPPGLEAGKYTAR